MSQIAENLAAIRGRIVAACGRAGRDPGSVQLIAVSKTFPAAAIVEAYRAGQRLFGENRVQEFGEKSGPLSELTEARWHLIGHLQTNKARRACELFHAVDSVDSLRLAEKLDTNAAELGKVLPILIEINIGGEAGKHGLPPESPELAELLTTGAKLRNIEIRGIMTVPPYSQDVESVRPHFTAMRNLRDRLASATGLPLPELSMGMSHDFDLAIEEGATCVRVGTAIFGTRVIGAGAPAR